MLDIFNIEELKEFINKKRKQEKFYLGEISDDTASALCLADSLFYNNKEY